MNITVVQAELHWEDKESNIKMLDNYLETISYTDLIVLPEMFSTAFSTRSSELAEGMDGATVKWMKDRAKINNAVVTGSLIIKVADQYFNRMIWARPDGTLSCYDKRHLFRMAGEHEHFSPGMERTIIDLKGWRIMLQVCYDLRFPVFARNRYMDGKYEYDLVIYTANWPSPRHNAWAGLLRARAIENLAYCIGVNRVGRDGNDLEYCGGSVFIDYLGNPIKEADEKSCIMQAEIKKEDLLSFRERFPTGLDADSFSLRV
jgi:predicted amidohydrolase